VKSRYSRSGPGVHGQFLPALVDSRANNGFFHKGKRGEAKGGKERKIKREEGPRITISTLWIRILNGQSFYST